MFMRDILYVDVVIFVIIAFGLIQKSPRLYTLRDFLSGRRFIIKAGFRLLNFYGYGLRKKEKGIRLRPLKL